jgi:DNA (cytosine-5)-methyltransferase 1
MKPTVIDLFSGVGGLSLGASRAGFELAAAVELDPHAFSSHAKNFPNAAHLQSNIATLSGAELLAQAGLKKGELTGLIGGPPCQGFSTMGKGLVDDPRNDLLSHFCRLVAETQPDFFLAENVPGILNEKYDAIRQAAFSKIPKSYVCLQPITVKANEYGAPTTRTRVFFIGYKPKKFSHHLVEQDFYPNSETESVVVSMALQGLPIEIDPEWQSEESGWQLVKKLTDGYFFDRVTNCIPRGVGCTNSIDRYFSRNQVSGCMGTRHSLEIARRYGALAYGQTDNISRSVKLNPEGFCPTLRAGTGSDKGSFQAVRPIHYLDPRVITPREAARLQGFPDWFVFHSTKWHSFRQIGNSVSPIVGEAILNKIHHAL